MAIRWSTPRETQMQQLVDESDRPGGIAFGHRAGRVFRDKIAASGAGPADDIVRRGVRQGHVFRENGQRIESCHPMATGGASEVS